MYINKNAPVNRNSVAKFLSEYVFQDANALMDLARTDRNVFQAAYDQIRRFIARLQGDLPNKIDLIKIDRMFAKAAKAANKATQTQKIPADGSGAEYMMSAADVVDRYDQRSYTNYGWVVANDVLSDVEYKSFNEQLGDAVNNKKWYPRTPDGEYMFWVNDQGQQSNKVVFASGSTSNPIISKIVEVDRNIVKNISDYVEELRSFAEYGIDYRIISEGVSDQKIYRSHEVEDLPSYSELWRSQQESRSMQNRNANRVGEQERRGSGAPRDGSTGVSYSLPTQPKAEDTSNANAEQAATETTDAQAPRKIVSEPMSEQGYADKDAMNRGYKGLAQTAIKALR